MNKDKYRLGIQIYNDKYKNGNIVTRKNNDQPILKLSILTFKSMFVA